jgi:hypothetical protein
VATLVYNLSATGRYTKLAEWNPRLADGNATATPALDAARNLYGTTGVPSDDGQGRAPYGAVFEFGHAEGSGKRPVAALRLAIRFGCGYREVSE